MASSVLDLAKINPELEQILKKGGQPKGLQPNTNIQALRAHIVAVKASMTAADLATRSAIKGAPVQEENRQIQMRDGVSITVRIYSPLKRPADGSGCPGFVMYHGGGFCLGSLESEVMLCRKWVTECRGVAVDVGYRLAPEDPFPAGVNDAYDALKWTAAHHAALNIDPKKGLIVGGISAGANFAAVVSHLYRDDAISPPLTGVFLSVPNVIQVSALPEKYKDRYLSMEQNKDALIMNKEAMDLFHYNYRPDPFSPLSSPLLFPSHKSLPRTYFQICGMDPLRDEALIYEQILREECGVETRVNMYPGLPHGFWSIFTKASFSQQQLIDTIEGMRWLAALGNEK